MAGFAVVPVHHRMVAVRNDVAHVFQLGPVFEVLKAIVCLDSVEVANFPPRRTGANECQEDEPVYADVALLVVTGQPYPQVSPAVIDWNHHSPVDAYRTRSTLDFAVKAADSATVTDFVVALVAGNGTPFLAGSLHASHCLLHQVGGEEPVDVRPSAGSVIC